MWRSRCRRCAKVERSSQRKDSIGEILPAELGNVKLGIDVMMIEARGCLVAYPARIRVGSILPGNPLAWWVFFQAWVRPPFTLATHRIRFFLIGAFSSWCSARSSVFDHHDINPELYVAKFGRKDLAYRIPALARALDLSAPPTSLLPQTILYRRIAVSVSYCCPVRCSRSGRPEAEWLIDVPPVEHLRCGRRYLVGYIGVIGDQEGVESAD